MSSSNLFILDIKTKSVTLSPLTTKLQTHLTELTNHHLNCIGFDSRGLIWIGTQDGLHVVNRATGREQNLHTDDGLVNNCIQSIIEDSEHRIWVSTANGISRIDTKTDKKQPSFIFTNYNHYDGVLGSEFISRSVFVDDNGEIYWGGIDGFNQINRNRIGQSSPSVQKPILSKLYISGKLVDKSTNFKGAPLLKKSLAATDEIELAHHQNFISVEFSAMNYINPFRTYYRYKLEGFEENWHVTTSTNGVGVATYTNLQPGNYILKMESTNKQNRWKNIHRELVIQIYPPIWQTPLFYALYLLIITIILYLIIKHLTRKNKVKREQQQKEALDQMKYSFFTNVSHELRTPLTLIITPLESIIKKSNDTILQRQLSLIKRNADDLLNLVNQLLDFRKLEMRGEQIQLSYCNLSDLITIVCQSFEEIATSKQIDFKWSSEQVDSAFLDANKLQKVINNLLSNAFKFTPEGGSISLKMTSSLNPVDNAPSFCIEVNDSGCGIPKDKITHIFDRFYQVNRDGESYTGSGIGLHMTKEYIQLHQGVVLVESDINKGSRFTVHIPSQLHPEYQSDNDNEISAEEQTVKLLLVEDNTNFRNFLKEELSEHYTIITACNGYEALEKMHQNNVDMIISDYGMPGMNGYELCHKIKSDINTSHTPFIMLTARTSDKDQMQSFEAGADAFISKPFNMDILLLRIQNLLAKKKERIELFKSAIIIQPQMVTSSTVDEVLIKTALNCIENHMADTNFTVEQLSNEMCMDRTGLFRKLKAVVGQSPSAFLKSVRLKRSATLLEKGLSVSEVAEMVGFSSLSYFSRSFVEEFGVKPSQYFKKREK